MTSKTFIDYYHNDSEFRKRHLDKLKEKVECECGFVTARCNLSRHKKSHLHIEKIEKIKRKNELERELEKINKELQKH
jgi:hypothetical protein